MSRTTSQKVEECVKVITNLKYSSETLYKATRVYNDRVYRLKKLSKKSKKGKKARKK